MPEPNSFSMAVANMRQAQREYFKTRDRDTLEKCKRLEAGVDEMMSGHARYHGLLLEDAALFTWILRLRRAQKAYFRTRSPEALDLSKAIEKCVDTALAAIGNPEQPGLFDKESK